MQPDLILVPFAQDAPAVNVDAIPVNLSPSDPPQAASYSQGFPTVTMTPLAAGGIPPRGQSFNGIFQDITKHLVYIGGGGQYKWSSAYVEATGGYSIGDVIQADSGLLSYVSLVDDNTDNFNTTPESIGPKWRAWAGGQTPNATTTQRGSVLLATQSQVDAGTGDSVVTPATRAAAAQSQSAIAFSTSGTGTAQILSPSPAISAYAARQRFNVAFNTASGANPTINVSGLGPKNLKQYDATGAKVSAVFSAQQISDVQYDGTDFVILDPLPPTINGFVGIKGAFKDLRLSTTGLSSIVTCSADEIIVENSANSYLTLRSVSITPSVASSGANGLDTGTSAANTWYSVWVIWNGSAAAGLLSLSATSPAMPSGYTHAARVGWIRTDSTANKYPLSLIQIGRTAQYKVAAGSNLAALPFLASGASGNPDTPTWSAVSISAFVPTTAGRINVTINGTGGTPVIVAPNNQYGGVGSLTNPPPIVKGFASGAGFAAGVSSLVLESTNVYWAAGGATNVFACVGWEDTL